MRFAIFIIGLAALAPTPGTAGGWMREQGETFVSAAGAIRHNGMRIVQETDIYAEHGVSPRLSVGVSLFEAAGSGHVLGFVRFPIRAVHNGHNLAVELALGAYHQGAAFAGLGRVTLGYGRSLTWGKAQGWLSVDAAIEQRVGLKDPMFKLDTTLGLSGDHKVRPMIKLGMTRVSGKSLIWQTSAHLLIDGPKNITWTIGIERKQAGGRSTALSLGLWRRF